MTQTPVALFVFNRPDLTRLVVERVRRVTPPMLLVVADGPRTDEEARICEEARAAVVDAVDWPCEVQTAFSPTNLGCRRRLSSGLDWVFSQVEEAIVLEDDCLPVDSFFSYCDELLARYRDDERVMHIGGVNVSSRKWTSAASYRFSATPHVWGWASWRRAWQHYDVTMAAWPAFVESGLLKSVTTSRSEEAYMRVMFDRTAAGEIDTWDYQWQFTCWTQSGLATVPRQSLVENVGFGPNATHTRSDPTRRYRAEEMRQIVHPTAIVRDRGRDAATFREQFATGTFKQRVHNRIWLTRWVLSPHSWRH